MYNDSLYNSFLYGSSGLLLGSEDQDDIVFNGYSLQSSKVITSKITNSTPSRDFLSVAVPRGDGEIITGNFWRRKVLTLRGVVKCATRTLLETELDTIKKNIAVPEGILDVKNLDTDVIRRYYATLINGESIFENREGTYLTFCPFEFQFLTVEPFGHSVDYDATTWNAQTDLSFDEQVENLGSIHAKPVVIVNFTAASGVTALSFTNNTTGEAISIIQSLVANDYVRFDYENMVVTVNGVEVDYSGTFPKLDTGVNSFTLGITGTSATYDLTVKHKTPYL